MNLKVLLWVVIEEMETLPFARTSCRPGLTLITGFYQGVQITSGKGVFQPYLGCFLTLLDLIQKLYNC